MAQKQAQFDAQEQKRNDKIARAGSELREQRLRAGVKKNPKLTLEKLGQSAWDGAKKGVLPGALYGSTLGPWGTAAGALTGAIVGAPVNMLYDVGGIGISDTLGVDEDTQKELRDLMEEVNKKNNQNKKR